MNNQQLEKLLKTAKSLKGRPYKYGAKPSEAPRFFDCSGFIQYLYKQVGYHLPRSTIEQAEKGITIKNVKNLKIGDLIFTRGERGHYNKKFPMGIGHVLMYLGNNQAIHAASKRIKTNPKIIEKGKVKIESSQKILKRNDVIVIKRILK